MTAVPERRPFLPRGHGSQRLRKIEDAIQVYGCLDPLKAAQIVVVISRAPILERWVGKVLVRR